MRKFRLLLLISLFVFCVDAVLAQSKSDTYTVKGQIMATDGKESVPYATIRIQDNNGKVQKMMATDDNGRFEWKTTKTGQFQVLATAVGFGSLTQKISVTKEKSTFDLGKLKMKDDATTLSEVTITEQKPLIKVDADKLTYSIENDPTSKGSNMIETMRNVPMLDIDNEDNIKLNGEANFKVLVNGKSNSMMSKNYKEVLKSLPADAVKEIEVITNPSSKYESEGVGGIINIITHKKSLNGFLGSVGANINNQGQLGANAYFQSRINKFDFSLNYWINQYNSPNRTNESQAIYFESQDRYRSFSNGVSNSRGFSQGGNFQASYEIDTMNLITASAGLYNSNSKSRRENWSHYENVDGDTTVYYTGKSTGQNDYYSISGNIDYQRSFAKKDKTFTASYKFDLSPQTYVNQSEIKGLKNYLSSNRRNNSRQGGSEHAIQLDYYDPLTENHQIEGGLKYILRTNDDKSSVENWDYDQQTWIVDPRYRNDVRYDQHILSVYAGYLFKYKDFSAKGGIRLESTWNIGTFYNGTEETPLKNTPFNVVPYVNLSLKVRKMDRIRLSYTQRLQRPGIWYLNPFKNDLDPFYISYGNMNLKSEISHTFGGGYSLTGTKYNANLNLGARFLNNAIEYYSTSDSQGIVTSTCDNIGIRRNYNASLDGSYSKIKNLTLSGGFGVRYNENKNTLTGKENNGFTYDARLRVRLTLWKDGSISVGGNYNSGWVGLENKGSAYYYYYFGINQQFFDRKLNVAFNANNPFPAWATRQYDSYTSTYESHSSNRYLQQRLSLSVTYTFGKMEGGVKKSKRSISNDDVKSSSGGE